MIAHFSLLRSAGRWSVIAFAVALAASAGAATRLYSQRRMLIEPNAEYDGRYTFVRLRYDVYRRSGWEFDYPAMERNFMTIVQDLSKMRVHSKESNISASYLVAQGRLSHR